MNPSLRQLVETLLWSETDNTDESGGRPLDVNYSPEDVDASSLEELNKHFQSFVEEASKEITDLLGDDRSSIDDFYTGSANSDYQAEHDFIMTANGHGCGFWEDSDWPKQVGEALTRLAKKHAEINAEVGDDGKIYLCFGQQ